MTPADPAWVFDRFRLGERLGRHAIAPDDARFADHTVPALAVSVHRLDVSADVFTRDPV